MLNLYIPVTGQVNTILVQIHVHGIMHTLGKNKHNQATSFEVIQVLLSSRNQNEAQKIIGNKEQISETKYEYWWIIPFQIENLINQKNSLLVVICHGISRVQYTGE